MNGVRRFFSTTNTKSSSSSGSEIPQSPQSGTLVDSPGPISLFASLNANFPPPPLNTLRKENSSISSPEKGYPAIRGKSGSPEIVSNGSHSTPELPVRELLSELRSDLPSTPSTHDMDSPTKPPMPSSLSGQPASKRNNRDDLLLSLLTSEAMEESQDHEILNIEEVEALREEQRLLASRIEDVKRKLNLELKLRDVSHNLRKLNELRTGTDSINGKSSTYNKVDAVNAELIRSLERSSRVDRRLLQHRSGVLSRSVQNLEKRLADENSDYTLNSNGASPSSLEMNARTSSSSTSTSTRTKFEGAHLFAGHAKSTFPASPLPWQRNRLSDKQHILTLEQKLKVSDEARELAGTKLATLDGECRQLRQQNIELEKSYDLQLRRAQDMIRDLERKVVESLDTLQLKEQWERDKREWDDERKEWESQLARWDLDRENWKENERNWNIDRQRLEDTVKSQRDMISFLEKDIVDLSATRMEREKMDQLVLQKDNELQELNEVMKQERASWQAERIRLNDEFEQARRAIYESRINETVNEALRELREILEEIVDLHEIPHDPHNKVALNLVSSVRNHLASLTTRMKDIMEEKSGLEDQIRVYESDLHEGSETQERLRQELDELQQLRYETTKTMPESKELPGRKESPEIFVSSSDPSMEDSKVVDLLKGLWAILPSVESRAARLPKGGSMSPISPSIASSLSDLDVRALKSLYDPKQGFVSPVVTGPFSIEEFVRRVHALVNDDRALIERLLRFAQSHDLLRNNAERAQKLAQESNKGLEMYQTQVRTLEERNSMLTRKQLTMLDEISSLQQSLDIITKEKHQLEMETMEQASAIQRLTETNNVLSTRGLLAEEGPMAMKAKLEAQLSEMQAKWQEAQDEIEQLRSIESSQRVALLNELNSLQQENNQLRDQLRSRK